MKPEELFIGAIVSFENRPCTVEHIERGIVCIKDIQTKTSHWITLTTDDIQPVPITPEILEKNGFSTIDIEGDIKQSETGGFYVWYEIDSNILGIEEDTSTYAGESSETLMKLRIFNVHELQAAMRLCGIEKEIIL